MGNESEATFSDPNEDELDRKNPQQAVDASDFNEDQLGQTFTLADATVAAYREVCDCLLKTVDAEKSMEATAFDLEPGGDLGALNVVLGVGLGISEDSEDMAVGPGEGCIHLYTAEPVSKDIAVNYAASALGVQSLSGGEIPVRAVHTGPIDLLPHRFRMRAAPGGISVGHVNITAGTLGCLTRGRSAPRDTRLLVLSNNHVLANVNTGAIGDAILQPGPADGGIDTRDRIGVLERFVTINFGGPNYVDCATAWVEPAKVRRELIYLRSGRPQFFRVGNSPVAAQPNQTVGKSGRTTQLTAGRVIATGVTIRVNMGGGRVAQFVNQIAIQGITGDFSRGGDSGSLIWTWDSTRAPVGLLFAGGGAYTFANPIQSVLNALDVDLYT